MRIVGLCTLVLGLSVTGCGDSVILLPDTRPPDGGVDGIIRDGKRDGIPDIKSDGTISTCTAKVETINGKAASLYTVLTSKDNQDIGNPGIKINVGVSVVGKPDGTTVSLYVTNLSPKPTATTSSNLATFNLVTIDDQLSVVTIRPDVEGCTSQSFVVNVQGDPTCEFSAPKHGATLTQKDNKNPGGSSFTYDVTLSTTNASGGQVILRVNGAQTSIKAPDPLSGVTVFADTVLPSQAGVTLEAEVSKGSLKSTCSATVNVDTTAPACSLSKPQPTVTTTSKGDGLGPKDNVGTFTVGQVNTGFTVTTEPGVNTVSLSYDGQTATATPSSNKAVFAVTMADGTKNIQATCTNTTTGNSGKSNVYQVIVDTTPPEKPTSFACSAIDHRGGKIDCTFPAVSDGPNGSGVEKYWVRYRQDSTIDDTNFDATDTIKVTPAPTASPVHVISLAFRHNYNFAMKAVDYLGNESSISDAAGPVAIDFKTQDVLGTATGQSLGFPIVTGDFNCDGYGDVAVGLYGANSNTGEVQLFFGRGLSPGLPLPSSFSKKISGSVAAGYFGDGLAALDFNNDGCTDLAVRAGGRDAVRGRVYLYLGRAVWSDRTDDANGTGAEIIYKLPSSAGASERLGQMEAGTDLDGDGYDDLAIDHFLAATGGWAEVLFDYGGTDVPLMDSGVTPVTREMPAAAEVQVTGGTYDASFGLLLARGGDLNGDKFGELLIGASRQQVGGVQAGAAYVLWGQARASTTPPEIIDITSSQRILSITGIAGTTTSFGGTMAGVGDFDGDGTMDLLVGDPQEAYGSATNAGAAYLFSMALPYPQSASAAKVIMRNDLAGGTGNYFGRTLANGVEVSANGVDLNNNGYADLVIGAAGTGSSAVGAALIFLGRASPPVTLNASQADLVLSPASGGTNFFSRALSFVGDLNGDHYPDLLVSDIAHATNTGRLTVYY